MNWGELLIILLVGIVVIKPERLSELAYKLAQTVLWFKKIAAQLKLNLEKHD